MTKSVMCLSIRQPWAYLITHGYKDIENRKWATPYRGTLLIHAAKGMTKAEYQECFMFAHGMGIRIPHFSMLDRGGIVGVATLVDCVSQHDSPWFVGPVGWVLADAKPVTFIPCAGQLGLFEVNATVLDMVMREVAR